MIKKIREFIDRRKSESLRGDFLEQVKKNPEDTRSRLKLGDLYAKRGQIAEASEQYAASAEIFAHAGFHLKSIALYRQVLKFQPGSVQALRRLGQLSLQYGLFADAIPYYQSLAEALRSTEGGERLLEIFHEVSSLPIRDLRQKALLLEAVFPDRPDSPADPYARLCENARAMIEDEAIQPDALELARWLSVSWPDRPEAYEILAILFRKSGDRIEFEKTVAKLKELYRTTRQMEQKEPFLRQFEENDEESLPSSAALGEKPTHKARVQPDQVKVKMEADVYELVRKKTEAQKGQREETGNGRLQQGTQAERLEFEDLFSTFKEGIREQVGQGDHETHYNLGVAYQEMGLYEDAIQEFELACGDPALRQDAHFLMGRCSAEMERWKEAVAYYEKVLSVAGLESEKSRGIRYELAVALRGMGRDEDALRAFQAIQEEEDNYRDTEQLIQEILKASNS